MEKGGTLWTFTQDERAVALDWTGRVYTDANETGLLGVALDPGWPEAPYVYLSWVEGASDTELATVIARFESPDGATLDPGSETLVFTTAQTGTNHNGGRIGFDADGMLLVPLGDGGGPGGKRYALEPDDPLGKIHRLDVSTLPASAPPDNPLVGQEGAIDTIWALGFRNPWGWDVDDASGELWVGDVGWNTVEEVDRVAPGGNYGWPAWEGSVCLNEALCRDDHLAPVAEYLHEDGGVSITGGAVYRGQALPDLQGAFVYTDIATGQLWAVRDGEAPLTLMDSTGLQVASFLEVDGELVLIEYAFAGGLHRLDPGEVPERVVPEWLSETGCVAPDAPAEPAEGLIPYTVRAPFHADGASKRRWVALPGEALPELDGTDLTFPVGTVLVKELRYGTVTETRLLMHHPDGTWSGLSYLWEGDDARLVQGPLVVDDWRIPSRSECLQCHTAEAGVSIGLELAQLVEVEAWQALGLLPEALPAHEPLDDGVRSWLHSNCAHCHRGEGVVSMDLRHDVALAETGLCGPPERGDLGLGDQAWLLRPGDPDASVLIQRLESPDAYRMPPDHLRQDEDAVAALRVWIEGLSDCE